MKKRFLLFGLIFALATLTSHAQIYQMFSQDFETGTPINYTTTGAVARQTTIVSGGNHAVKLTHTQSAQEVVTLDTIDFSANASLNYFTLEFMHIAFVDPVKGPSVTETCLIEAKRPDQTNWIRLNSSHYNMTDGGSDEFNTLGTFSSQSYPGEWAGYTAVNNTMWKQERFDLDMLFQGVATTDKKLEIRFILSPRTAATGTDAWYIDDIRVRASSQQIVTPRIAMRSFPDALNYPNSRGAKIVCDVTTTVSRGIHGDSVFAVYRVGNSSRKDTAYLHRVAPGSNRFEGRIPFVGYDTLIHYHVVAKDSTTNYNTVFYPKNSSQWKTYRCVRGRTNTGYSTANTSQTFAFPFTVYPDNRSEFIYDSVTLAEWGFGPGAITKFNFKMGLSPQIVTRPHLQFRMANVPGTYTRTATNETFTTSDMQIVYDSALRLDQCADNTLKTINLQDTFFYAGGDIIVQVFYDGGSAPLTGTNVKHIPIAANKYSLFLDGFDGTYGFDAFGSDIGQFLYGTPTTTRPWMQFFESKNVPLVYDCGISALAYPSYDVPSIVGTDSVVVWLKNFGAQTIDSCGIYYQLDDGAISSVIPWTGSLNPGDSVRVMLSTSQNFTVGYHTMRAWVGDYIKVNGGAMIVRDHEPLNDTTFSPFASCSGPYSGTRTVGTGSGAHFASLEKCLYALSRCGIDAPLTIKLPAGVYDVTKFPFIPGTSEANYVLFEPATPTAVVTFRRTRRGVNTNAASLVDLTEARSIRFNNIRFSNGTNADNRCNVLARLGRNSSNCQFLNCSFVDSNAVTASAQSLINSGYADSTLIKYCTFYGGTVGVDVNGPASDDRSSRNTIQFNDFANQVNSAIRVVNQNHVLVDSNYCNDVQTNASYVILGQYCYEGSRIVRNRVFNTKGACCIGVSDFHGSASEYSVVANNMVVSLDDGTTNMLTTPLNIIKGSYIKAVFNSVRMSANERVNVAAATFGGDVLTNSYFQNNVIATFDTMNYAFSFVPGTNLSTLHVDHNCYYSTSGVLNKLTGVNYTSLNGWLNAVPMDEGSVVGNPNYTNSSVSRVDLRSFNALLRNVGTPVPEVTDDLFGTTRNATHPSLGAYEVAALSVDFAPVEFITPLEDYCGAPSSIPVEVAVRNTGSGTYTYVASSPIRIYYSIDNGPVQNFSITGRNVGPGDTIHFLSTRTMSLPSGANNTDRTYNIRWWVKCTLDPDDLNDTSTWTVISRYAAPAPTVINQNVAYGNSATITPTAGINTWPVSYYTSGNGRQQRSGISWYSSMDASAPFYYGPTFTTEPVFADTTFYISQKRNLPLVKITEVQVNRTAAGATNPMPSWMLSSTAFAVELTNCGDYPAELEGDSIIVVQPTTAAKVWVLPRVTIQPGENLVLQFKTSTTPSDSSRTIFAPSTAIVAPAYTTNFGIIYRDGHGVADAVAFNNVITAASTQAIRWGNQNIPAAVWQGSAIDLAQNGTGTNTPTAGARRIAWPTNAASASPTATATLWQVATTSNLMHVGETETNLIRYYDNGCEGLRSAVNIHVTNVPSVDLCVSEVMADTGCNLSVAEPVMARVHNYGSSPVSNVIVKYSTNGGATVACTDTIPTLGTRSAITHTFSTPLNMHASSDTTFNLKVWVVASTYDANHQNDTATGSFFSAFTPNTPYINPNQSVNYGDRLTISATGMNPSTTWIIWSDANHVDIDTTTGSYQTPYVYRRDTMYYRAIALKDIANTHVGNLTSIANNNYPSPYNPKTRYVKEQYLYTADQIRAAGHDAGTISSVSFFLAALGTNVTDFTYSYYKIKMGTTSATTFANTNYLTGLTPVYTANNLRFTDENIGWVKHTLNTPFVWDGTSSIVIEVTRALSTTGISAGANTRFTAQANTVLTKQHASNSMDNETAAASRGGNRPDIMFGFLEPVGCESVSPEEAPVIYIDVDNIPSVDASIAFDPALDTTFLASCDTSVINVVLTNRGGNNLNDYTLRYKIDNNSWQQTTGNAGNLPLGYDRTVRLLATHLTPGRHTIRGVVNVAGDTISSNDTIVRTFNVRFCAGSYQVGSCAGSDYPTLADAIDTLHNAGVAGHVFFDLCPQTFNEQVNIGNIAGTSRSAKVTFRTKPGSTQMATITHTPTNTSNYVLGVNASSFVNFDSIYFYGNYTTGSGNNIFANVLSITGSDNISIRNSVIRSKKTAASSTNANLVVLGTDNHYINIENSLLDSGYYAVRSLNNQSSDNVNITNCDITNFWYQGIYLRNTDTINISDDSLHAGVTVAGKPLTGIYLANAFHATVQRNFIFMVDNATGGKRGIVLMGCRGTNIDRVNVYNNMISLRGTAVASLVPTGVYVDSLSKHMNVYYNSCRLYAGANQPTTMGFSVQRSSAIHVLNNIFDNESKGYAAFVAVDTCVSGFNYNCYYSNSEPNVNTGARKFVRWGTTDFTCLDSLRAFSGKDINSLETNPLFFGELDLRLRIGHLAERAQYNPDVTTDVFGNIRPQIPQPTIGSWEFNSVREIHDVAVATIIEPSVPAITTGANAVVNNIETDPILVRASFFNNGTSNLETNCTWYAYLEGVSPAVISQVHTLPALGHDSTITDTVYLASPLGIVDTQRVIVVINIGSGVTDARPIDNRDTTEFFIYPAYNLQIMSAVLDSTVDAHHCRMYDPPIRYTIKNSGYKDFPGDFNFNLGYDYYCSNPSSVSFPNIPTTMEFPGYNFGAVLPVGISREVVLNPADRPNLYPTGYSDDITIRFRGWVHYEYDVKPANDTTNYANITSNHTPNMPIAHDTMVDYGTYANLWATQTDGATNNKHFVIHWTRDSMGAPDFYTGTNNYNRSTHWSTTPQFFHDSTYYLYCVSDKGCTSYYQPINVGINPAKAYDVSISKVLSPRASGRVYLEKDTVKLRVVNYGSQPISNIPIAFKWMNANGRTTYLEVHDTVRATIPGRTGDDENNPNEVHHFDYVFDTALLNVNNPLPSSDVAYTLDAWVYHPQDMQRGNDTLRTPHTFYAKSENTYNGAFNPLAQVEPEVTNGFDITRVSFNELDNLMPDLIGYDHLVLGNYNAALAEVPTLYMRKGTTDTLTISVANNEIEADTESRAALFVLIDYNRDGAYSLDNYENLTLTHGATFDDYSTTVTSRKEFKLPYTVPADKAQYGYMRMMVFVVDDTNAGKNGVFTEGINYTQGQKQEYLIFIQEDSALDTVDAALTRVESPRNNIVTERDHIVTVVLANKGATDLTSAAINYSLDNGTHVAQTGTVNWSGLLAPGMSTSVALDSLYFHEGTSNLTCEVVVPGDTFHTANNVLHYQYHRYYVVELRFIDSFDLALNKWYAPVGYNNFTRNYWDRNTPTKNVITSAYSQPNAYVTDASQTIVTGKHGNRSVLYTPLISIRRIKADTLTFVLSKNLTNGSYLRLEYYNYLHEWVPVDDPSARYGQDDNPGWYDDENGWTGNEGNGAYITKSISTALISGDFDQVIQFRFVYETPVAATANAAFGDGCAIDDFHIGRARRSCDVGVTAITHPVAPQFGQTIRPRVIIHNYGLDPIQDFIVAYRPYGVYLAPETVCPEVIPPDGDIEFEFPNAFTIDNTYPDTFQICAYTRVNADIYYDNDTTCASFGLAPLAHDLYMYHIVSPMASAVAGDSVSVTVRLRNFGQNEIDSCTVSYRYNNGDVVTESVNFEEYLGRNLGSTEFFNYTFKKRVRATIGTMQIETWCNYRLDTYPYNDTLKRSVAGIASITDVQATAGIIDLRDQNVIHFEAVIDNVGARMANNFTVGFWYDNDTSTLFQETFYCEGGIPSGGRVVHKFSRSLTDRGNVPVNYLTVFVSHPSDTNHNNDTTNFVSDYVVDVSLDHVEVEETRSEQCRVRFVITNVGTGPYYGTLNLSSRINNKNCKGGYNAGEVYINPGETRHLIVRDAQTREVKYISRSDDRTYTGSANLIGMEQYSDHNQSNDQTTDIRVVNYFEDVPQVGEYGFIVEQNYPNPVVDQTSIEFVLPYCGTARFFVTDVVGRPVYEKVADYIDGRHTITFSRKDLPSGVYYYGIEFDGERRLHKMIIK